MRWIGGAGLWLVFALLTGWAGEVGAQSGSSQSESAGAAAQPAGDGQQLADLLAQIQNLRSELQASNLQGNLFDIAEELFALRQRMADLVADFQQADEQRRDLNGGLEKINYDFSQHVAQSATRYQQLSDQMAATGKRFDALVDGATQRFADLQQGLAELQDLKQASGIFNTNLINLYERIDSLDARVAALGAALGLPDEPVTAPALPGQPAQPGAESATAEDPAPALENGSVDASAADGEQTATQTVTVRGFIGPHDEQTQILGQIETTVFDPQTPSQSDASAGSVETESVDGQAIQAEQLDIVEGSGESSEPSSPTNIATADPAVLYQSAERAIQQFELESAKDQFAAIVNQFPDYEKADQAAIWLGRLLIEQGELQAALGVLNAAQAAYPSSNHAGGMHFFIGQILNRQDRPIESCYSYLRAREYADPPGHNYAARAAQAQGQQNCQS
ncbi:MAG: hypothetical protein AAF418_02010 [Pseudomonadota bacterium]